MSESLKLDNFFNQFRSQKEFQHLDAGTIDDVLRSIRNNFAATQDPFERHRAIGAQIGATDSPELRRLLMQLRERFEADVLATTIDEIQQAFGRSPEEGWRTWLIKLATALWAFQHRHSLRLCEEAFPFDAVRQKIVADVRLAVGWMLQSRWDEAYEQLDFLSRQECLPLPLRARLVAIVGQIDFSWFGKMARARARLVEAERMAPADGMVLAYLGDYFRQENDFTKTTDYYRRAIQLSPGMVYGYAGMGDQCDADQRLGEGERTQKAEEWYSKAIAVAKGSSVGYGRLFQLLGRPANLGNREKEFLAVAQTRADVDPEDQYDTFLEVSQAYLNNNRFSEAREWNEKAIALQRQWPRAYAALAEMCRAQGNESEAEAHCNKAMMLSPECPSGYLTLAGMYEGRSQWQDALDTYDQFPQLSRPLATFMRVAIGRMHAKLGNFAEAERLLVEEVRLDAEESYASRALEEIAAEHYQKRGDAESARRVYDELLKILGDPYRGGYHNLLGNMHYVLKQYKAAIEEYQQAIAAPPDKAVYHRNLSAAYELTNDYENAGRELQSAFQIDRDESLLRQAKASLANGQGKQAYTNGNFLEAKWHFTTAVGLDKSQAAYHTNLAAALELLKEPGKRAQALDEAIRCYENAREIIDEPDYTAQIDRLRRRRDVARVYGEKPLDYVNTVTPLVVEVGADLIPYVVEKTSDSLSEELLNHVENMRTRIREQLGVRIPGVRFRRNEVDLPKDAYLVMLNEIPLVVGNLQRIGQKSNRRRLTSMMRHVEAVVRKNAGEFLGPQEVISLLKSENTKPIEDIRTSSQMVIGSTTVCKALLAEEVPIIPFVKLCTIFHDLHATGVHLREIVERIRALPAFRKSLPANDGRHSFLKLGSIFEAGIRRSLYERDGRSLLAMEPEQCQEALTAVRDVKERFDDRLLGLVVEDAALRPFVRKLVELEFPNLHVLSRGELRTDAQFVSSGPIESGTEPTTARVEFRRPRRFDANGIGSGMKARSRTLLEMEVTVFISKGFEIGPSAVDDQSLPDLFALMRDALFYELGIILPRAKIETDPSLNPREFIIRVNGEERRAGPLPEQDEFLVNDNVHRLKLLKIDGRDAINPANGNKCAIVRNAEDQVNTCKKAGLTTWGPRGYLVLELSARLRKAAAKFQIDDMTQYILDTLRDTMPDLVRLALERYSLPQISAVLRELLSEEISIRDLRSILESLLSIAGTTDVDLNRFIVFFANSDALCAAPSGWCMSDLSSAQLADFVRTCLRSYISNKYARGGNSLVVFLLDPAIEKRILDIGERPLTEREGEQLQSAIRKEIENSPSPPTPLLLLTSFEVRRALRIALECEFPHLTVLSYQELSANTNIQPIARVSWGNSH